MEEYKIVIEKLESRLDVILTRFQEVAKENFSLKESMEEYDRQINILEREIKDLKDEKSESIKRIEAILEKIPDDL